MIQLNSAGDSISQPDHWKRRWARFLSEHGDWWSRRTASSDAVYAIPKYVIDELCNLGPSGPRRHNGRRFFSEDDAQSERAFSDHCQSQNQCVVGVNTTDDIIHFDLLSQKADWQPNANRKIEVSDRIAAKAWNRHRAITESQLVHVALLIQQPCYWRELMAIRTRWQELRDDLELPFNSVNGRSVPFDAWVTEAQLEQSQSSAESELRMALWHFSQKWEVAAFLTWELPIPKRPVTHPPPASCDSLRVVEQPSFSMPSYFAWSRLFGDGKPVWNWDRSSPITEGLGTETSGDRFVKKHSDLLHLYLAEIAVCSRFCGSLPHRGVTCFLRGMERELGISSEHVKRFRKCYRAAFVND